MFWSFRKDKKSNDSDLDHLLGKIKEGDKEARNQLIQRYLPFIVKTASAACGRFVRVGEDDEVSVGLIAFNEAIDSYEAGKGLYFLPFAERVIRRRLVDYYRKESRDRVTPFSSLVPQEGDEEGDPLQVIESKKAVCYFVREQEQEERRLEIINFSKSLAQFGITFQELVTQSPKHEDARRRAMQVAKVLVTNADFRERFIRKKELPLKELEKRVEVSRKTLERQRKYIIAMVLIFLGDYPYLKEYLEKV